MQAHLNNMYSSLRMGYLSHCTMLVLPSKASNQSCLQVVLQESQTLGEKLLKLINDSTSHLNKISILTCMKLNWCYKVKLNWRNSKIALESERYQPDTGTSWCGVYSPTCCTSCNNEAFHIASWTQYFRCNPSKKCSHKYYNSQIYDHKPP